MIYWILMIIDNQSKIQKLNNLKIQMIIQIEMIDMNIIIKNFN